MLAYTWMSYVGIAKMQLETYAEAIVWFRRSIEANRNYPIAHFNLAAALAQAGELSDARAAVKAGLSLHPGFTIGRLRAAIPQNNHPNALAARERYFEGMRMAGVPEGKWVNRGHALIAAISRETVSTGPDWPG